MTSRPIAALASLAASLVAASAAGAPLGAYNVDPAQSSVSGLSSGGFMAAQVHVAFSATFRKGAGIVAGGAFYCAQNSQNQALQKCMDAQIYGVPSLSALISQTNTWAAAGLVDPTSNLAGARVWLFTGGRFDSGTRDTTVDWRVMDQAQSYYQNYIASANIFYKSDLRAEHAMPTDHYGRACNSLGEPFISNCNYDAAGEILKWIYGPLAARNTNPPAGNLLEFDQSEFIANPAAHGMWPTGWVYVPASCAGGAACRLHVVFHGCKQYPGYQYYDAAAGQMVTMGNKYALNTGYNRWADTNNIVVLYPQANVLHSGINGKSNPNGCWDWWGYDDDNYAKKTGRQMAAVKAMVDRIASGHVALPAPTGLAVTGTTDTTASLAWNAVPGAVGYNVYRGGARVNASAVATTSYTDSGLAPGTTYSYTVKAVASGGGESAASSAVNATTTGAPPPPAAPTNVGVSGATSSSLTVTWTAAAGATGYNVYRSTTSGGPYARANAAAVGGSPYTDTGLAASTTYHYVVRSLGSGGAESANSAQASGTTLSGFTCTQTTTNNYNHVQAGRAYASGGYAWAKGSNQNMGLYNVYYTTTLANTAPDYYVIGNCP